ncbi:MAG: aminotransferase class V-fold PLP-dependent enzyme [Gammaproteobacteria bacterium]
MTPTSHTTTDVEALIGEFELKPGLIYLNHAMAGPWPRRTRQAIQDFSDEAVELGASRVADWGSFEVSLRMRYRRLLNADSVSDIALLKNTSEAISMVAFGLPWQRGDNVVLPAQEFPSNHIAWSALGEAGVELRRVDWGPGEDAEAKLMEACDENTRLLSVSAVQFSSGFRMDLERLGAFAHGNDILFCVDAIQQLGALPFDLKRCHADFVMAGAHKWQCAPEGLAVFWSSPAVRDSLAPTQLGWRSRADMLYFEPGDEWQLEKSARRFESGTISQLNIRATDASLSLLEDIGMDQVSALLADRVEQLIQGLQSMPAVTILSDTSDDRRSGIVTFRIDGDNDALYSHLKDNGVFCAKRLGGIRLAPHFHTSIQDLHSALGLIDAFLSSH